jgi:multisubunit Na+/H+ antiporter MnhF subunit
MTGELTLLQLAAAALVLVPGVGLSLLRLLRGPTTPDRVAAADTLAVITTAGLAALAAVFDNPVYLDIALVYGTLAFVGTVAIARAIEGNRQ